MGNSTISLQTAYDGIAARGIPDPRQNASGFGDLLALELASRVAADLICERFNWKWNRANAAAIYTNSWQQDYPQPAQTAGAIGWGEDCDLIDINNTQMPKPLRNLTWRRQLSRTSTSLWRPNQICWMYNYELSLGSWPGAGVTYYPLVTTSPNLQNPLMSMTDANGNILIVTGFGTTGTTAPVLPAGSAEGTEVTDGTVEWTCVSANSQGFRIDALPSATGPTWQILPYYQMDPPTFTTLGQLLNPIPNTYSRHFISGLESECLKASPNPADVKRGELAREAWIKTLVDVTRQGNREMDTYSLVPLTRPVESRWDECGPYTADRPF